MLPTSSSLLRGEKGGVTLFNAFILGIRSPGHREGLLAQKREGSRGSVLRSRLAAKLALGLFIMFGIARFLCPDVGVRSSLATGQCLQLEMAEARPDLTVSLRASIPSAPRQDVSLSTTVKNIGPGSAPPSSCDVIIRNARPPRQELRRYQEAIPALDPGDAFTFLITLKPGFGAYEVCAVADPKNLVVETDETNNRSCETVTGK